MRVKRNNKGNRKRGVMSNMDAVKADKADVPNWLNAELFVEFLQREFEDYKAIRDFQVLKTVGTGENYTTLLLRVKIELELKDGSTVSLSYMAKVLPANESTAKMVDEWKVFDKEQQTYANYLPEFEQMYRKANKQVTFGAKYHKIANGKHDGELLLLEDLSQKGFKNIKRQDGLDLVHTKAALEKLAQFHAASAVHFELKGSYPAKYDRNLCANEDEFDAFRSTIAKKVINLLPTVDAAYMEKSLQEYTSQCQDMYQAVATRFGKEFQVLNHGDAWSNNIMYQYDDSGRLTETYLVDFQMSRYCSPAQDLIYLLLSSVSYELKLPRFDYFVHYYHEKLTENLKLLQYPQTLPSLKDLHKSIYDHSDWVYPTIFILMPMVLMNPHEKAKIDILLDVTVKDDFKDQIFSNSRVVRELKALLPWAYHRGSFTSNK